MYILQKNENNKLWQTTFKWQLCHVGGLLTPEWCIFCTCNNKAVQHVVAAACSDACNNTYCSAV